MEDENIVKNSSPNWKKPDEVMKYYRLKQKKRALSSRMNGCDNVSSMFSHNSNSDDSVEYPAAKRRNPFVKRFENKTVKKTGETTDESGIETDVSSDTTLFLLLNNAEKKATPSIPRSFANILQHLNEAQKVKDIPKDSPKAVKKYPNDGLYIPIDWSLKSKIRIMSPESFSWTSTLKTCEEACSITGFVRCLDAGKSERNFSGSSQIDVTTNAKFHQSCLYWLHPNIPWLTMFPRSYNCKIEHQILTAQLLMTQSLVTEWTTAFKSLYQLVRVNQCPYFYMIANHFQCLFRAAGMAGIEEIHAIITPTTSGFRKMLENEGVVFTMPLKKKKSNNKSNKKSENDIDDEDFSDGEDWLDSLPVDEQEIKKIKLSQKLMAHSRDSKIDNSDESLVLVQGMEVQSFFNLLVNCKSCIPSTGPFAGIPPTLISPSAFLHGTLKCAKIRDSLVQVDGSVFHSIQVEGPILPHALRQICDLLNKERIQYSISLSTLKHTSGFTEISKRSQIADEKKKISTLFLKENLGECGLSENHLNVFCDPDPEMYDNIESISTNSLDR